MAVKQSNAQFYTLFVLFSEYTHCFVHGAFLVHLANTKSNGALRIECECFIGFAKFHMAKYECGNTGAHLQLLGNPVKFKHWHRCYSYCWHADQHFHRQIE